MVDIIVQIYGILALFAFIPFFALYYLFRGFRFNHQKAWQKAADVTTFLLLGAVSELLAVVFGWSGGWFWVIFTPLIMMLLGLFAQWRLKGEIDFLKLSRAAWRVTFVILGAMYIILLLAMIIIAAVNAI